MKLINRLGGSVEVILWISAIYILFVLPWKIGGLKAIKGESYAFGFNNRLGIIYFGICVLMLSAYKTLIDRKKNSKTSLLWINSSHKLFPSLKDDLTGYIILIIYSGIAFIFTIWWNAHLVIPYWGGELQYFLGRVDLIALGWMPYRDFQFNYGPALLYIPYWISHFSFGLIGLEDAYALCVAACTALGFISVYIYLQKLALPEEKRPIILLLGLSMWGGVTMGLNYTPLRFGIVPCMLIIFDYYTNKSNKRNFFYDLSIAFIVSGVCLMISPEMGIASAVGLTTYGIIYSHSKSRRYIYSIISGIILSMLLMQLMFNGYLSAVASFSTGLYNFPIYPNAHNILLCFSTLIIIPSLISGSINNFYNPVAPIALSIACSAGVLLPSALGRCDPGHVIYNGYTLFLMMFAVAATKGRNIFKLWILTFFIVIVVMGQISYWNICAPMWRNAWEEHNFYSRNTKSVKAWKDWWDFSKNWSPNSKRLDWRKTPPYPSEISEMISGKKVAIPLGVDIGTERLLKMDKAFNPKLNMSFHPEMYEEKDVDVRIKELVNYDIIIIPERYYFNQKTSINLINYEKSTHAFLSSLLLIPVSTKIINHPYIPEIDFINKLIPITEVIESMGGNVFLILKK
jgi:hypothetical protein